MAQIEGLGDSFFVQTFTTTLQRYEKQLVDNVLLEHPALELFKSVAKSVTGRGLVVPIRADVLTYTPQGGSATTATGYTAGSSGEHSIVASNEIMGSAVYEWASEIITPFRLKHRDILQNSGPEQIVSLVEEYVKAAQASHQDFIVTELHKHRQNYIAGGVMSLDMLVGGIDSNNHLSDSDIPGGALVGGIDASTKTYWQATRLYSPATGAGADDIVAAMRKVTNLVYKRSRKRPTDVIAGFDCFEELEAYLMGKGQYTNPQGTANTRFTEIKFGDLTVRLDPDCQPDRMYFLNRASLRFAYCAGEFMKSYAAVPVQGTLDTVVPIASTLLFGVSERRANGLLVRKEAWGDELVNAIDNTTAQ
jgi:hypothetical protein